jgi:hypothetical protein
MQSLTCTRPLALGFKEFVWRKGDERCERSSKKEAQHVEAQHAEEPSTKDDPPPAPALAGGFRQVSTKREEANTKMNERYLVGQATQNPFMSANNYANDIEVQMNFLTPQKSC